MDVVDLVLLVLLILAVLRGLRLGAMAQILGFGGFLGGLTIGAMVADHASLSVHEGLSRDALVAIIVLGSALIAGSLGRALGLRCRDALKKIHLGPVDTGIGVLVAVAAVVLVAWFVASTVSGSRFTWINNQIQKSALLKGIGKVMPPVPNAFSKLSSLLTQSGFPPVFSQLIPSVSAPVTPSSDAEANAIASRVEASMVKVLGQACGYEQEGSGFSVGTGLVVTNAHVVAGEALSQVVLNNSTYNATPILFDPTYDIAVLATNAPLGPALSFDPSTVPRSTLGAVLGYPLNHSLTIGGAGVAATITAIGRNIYGQGSVTRQVYQIDANVEPGNSGGPLVDTEGQVIGVVFSRSTTDQNVGYALTSLGVMARVDQAKDKRTKHGVSTQSCTEG